MTVMSTLKAEVKGGQAVVKELDAYPDGTVIELAVVSDGELTDAQLARLDAEVTKAKAEMEAGHKVPADEVLAQLRSS